MRDWWEEGWDKKTGQDDFGAAFICAFFQSGWDKKIEWDNFCLTILSKEFNKWFHNFPLLVEILDKVTCTNSIFKFKQFEQLWLNVRTRQKSSHS